MRLAGRIEPGSGAGPFTGQPAGRFGLAAVALSRPALPAAGRAGRCAVPARAAVRFRAVPALLGVPLLVTRLRAAGDAVELGRLAGASLPPEDCAAAGSA